jgi:hypothetical protein
MYIKDSWKNLTTISLMFMLLAPVQNANDEKKDIFMRYLLRFIKNVQDIILRYQ